MQDFSRVYKMLSYVESQEGPFDYRDPKMCLFGIGRRSVHWVQRLLHFVPFGNGGDHSFGEWLGLTDKQHWELYCSLGFIARELGWKHEMNTLDRRQCVMAAKYVLAKWEGNEVRAWLCNAIMMPNEAWEEADSDERRTANVG